MGKAPERPSDSRSSEFFSLNIRSIWKYSNRKVTHRMESQFSVTLRMKKKPNYLDRKKKYKKSPGRLLIYNSISSHCFQINWQIAVTDPVWALSGLGIMPLCATFVEHVMNLGRMLVILLKCSRRILSLPQFCVFGVLQMINHLLNLKFRFCVWL